LVGPGLISRHGHGTLDGFGIVPRSVSLWSSYYNNDGTPSVAFDPKLKKYVLFTRHAATVFGFRAPGLTGRDPLAPPPAPR